MRKDINGMSDVGGRRGICGGRGKREWLVGMGNRAGCNSANYEWETNGLVSVRIIEPDRSKLMADSW